MFFGAAGRVSLLGMIYGGYGSGYQTGEQLGVSLGRVGISSFHEPLIVIRTALKIPNKHVTFSLLALLKNS
jgi:hypothetical protein